MLLREGSPSLFRMMSILHQLATEDTIALLALSLTALLVRTANTAPETSCAVPQEPEVEGDDVVPFLLRVFCPPSPVSTRPEKECGSLSATHFPTHLVLLELSST